MSYGMGPDRLSAELGMSREEAEPIFAQYHAHVPFVRQLAYECERAVADKGYIRTLLGRHRHFPKGSPRHKALNALIQGSGADMIKKAMLDLYDEGVVPLITVHDELDFSVEDRAQARQYRGIMEDCVALKVPLKVDVGLGLNWGRAK